MLLGYFKRWYNKKAMGKISTVVKNVIKSIKSDIRNVHFPLEETRGHITTFIKRIGWKITGESVCKETITITSCNSDFSILKLFTGRKPQIATWNVSKYNDKSIIEIEFSLFRKFRIVYYLVLSLFMIGIYAGIAGLKFLANEPSEVGKIRFFALLGGFSVLGLYLFYTTTKRCNNYEKFKHEFYKNLHALSGLREILVKPGGNFPELLNGFFFIIILFAPLIFSFFISETLSIFFPLALMLAFLGVILLWFLLSLLADYTASVRVEYFSVNLIAGMSIAIYCSIPLLLKIIPLKDISYSMENGYLNAAQANVFYSMVFVLAVFFCVSLLRALCNLFNAPEVLMMRRHLYSSCADESAVMKAYSKESSKTASFKGMTMSLLLAWAVSSMLVIFGFYFSLSCVEYALSGKVMLFPNGYLNSANDVIRFTANAFFPRVPFFIILRPLFLFYSLPVIAVAGMIMYKNVRKAISFSMCSRNVPVEIVNRVERMCHDFNIPMPRIVVRESQSLFSNVETGLFRNTLLITKKVVNMLKDEEMAAIIAHELGHISKHIFAYRLLNPLSEWTFFGKGFFVFVLNTRQMEFEADDFCVKALSSQGINKSALINALNKVVAANSMLKFLAPSSSLFSFADYGVSDSSWNNSLAGKLRTLYGIYFGDLVISYIHPTIDERIARIEAMQ